MIYAPASCRSDCREPVTRRVVATSDSGRRRFAHACANERHLNGALAAVKYLGFTVESIEPVRVP